jgi:hypothetical protein
VKSHAFLPTPRDIRASASDSPGRLTCRYPSSASLWHPSIIKIPDLPVVPLQPHHLQDTNIKATQTQKLKTHFALSPLVSMSDVSDFTWIESDGYQTESESLGLPSTPTPTPDSANQQQGKMAHRKPIIIHESSEKGMQSTDVALSPTPNTTLELKGHQDSNSEDTIIASNNSTQVVPRLMLNICPKASLIYLKQILLPGNESLSTTSSDAPELLSQDLNQPLRGLQMESLQPMVADFGRLKLALDPVQVLENTKEISLKTASPYNSMLQLSGRQLAGRPTSPQFLYEFNDARLSEEEERNHKNRIFIEIGREAHIALRQEPRNACFYRALPVYSHLIIRLNELWMSKNPKDENSYKILRTYVINSISVLERDWLPELKRKHRDGPMAEILRCYNECLLIQCIGQRVVVRSTNLLLEGRLDWATLALDFEHVKIQVTSDMGQVGQPEFELSKMGFEYSITAVGVPNFLQELYPEALLPYTSNAASRQVGLGAEYSKAKLMLRSPA